MSNNVVKMPTNIILIGLLAGSIAATLNGSLLNVAVPLFMDIFDASVTTTQWLVAGYILATGLISPSVGYLGDRFGFKKIYVFSLVAIFITSALCAIASTIHLLIIFRFLQGIAGGIIMPVSLALIYQLIPKDKQALSVSLWNVGNVGGGVLGPVLTGWLLNYVPWQWLFLIGWPMVFLALFLSVRLIPNQMPSQGAAPLDFIAMSTVSICSVLVLLAFSNGNTWGWRNPLTLSFMVIGLIGVIYFIKRCLKAQQPLLNLSVFKYRHFVSYILLDFSCSNITYAFIFIAPLFFQNALGLSIFETSLVTLPSAMLMVILMPFVGGFYNKVGPRILILSGVIIAILATVPLVFLTTKTPLMLIIACFMCRSVGLCLISTPAINLGMSAVPAELAGHASAIANWLKQISGSLIISLSSVFMIYRMEAYKAQLTMAETTESLLYTLATRDIFIYMLIVLIVAFPLAWAVPKHKDYAIQNSADR